MTFKSSSNLLLILSTMVIALSMRGSSLTLQEWVLQSTSWWSLDRIWEERESSRNISAENLMALLLTHSTGTGSAGPIRTGEAAWRTPGGVGNARVGGGVFTARQLRLLGEWAFANHELDAAKLVHVLRRSVALAKSTCRQLFASERWNCPVNYLQSLLEWNSGRLGVKDINSFEIFSRVISTETREFAFWHATMAASLKYGLAMACYIGYLPCRCRQYSPSFACQLTFGERWAAYFMAPPRIEGRFGDDFAYTLSLRHNLAVGRHIVREEGGASYCLPIGVSASTTYSECTNRTHFSFSQFARALKRAYDLAVPQTQYNYQIPRLIYADSRLIAEDAFCGSVGWLEWPGTYGRECDSSSLRTSQTGSANSAPSGTAAADTQSPRVPLPSCSHVCCGRGFDARRVRVERPCNCRVVYDEFYHTECDTCSSTEVKHHCF